MPNLSDKIKTVTSKAASVSSLTTRQDMQRLRRLLQKDIAAIVAQINDVYYPVLSQLGEAALDGVTGDVLVTKLAATSSDNEVFWGSNAARALHVKESFDVVIGQIAELQNDVTELQGQVTSDSSDATARANANAALERTTQLRLDAFRGDYTFVSPAAAQLTYPLARHIKALGSKFSGFPGIDVAFEADDYPVLTLEVLLSEVTIDTTLAQSTITDLPDHLSNIRDFTGMTDATDGSPTYSAYGSLTTVADGDSLEEAIYKLDAGGSLAVPGSDLGFVARTAAGTYDVVQWNASSGADPTTTDDSASGYAIGSVWRNTTDDRTWLCVDAAVSAAIWRPLHGDLPDDVKYLFGDDDDGEIYLDSTSGDFTLQTRDLVHAAATTGPDAAGVALRGGDTDITDAGGTGGDAGDVVIYGGAATSTAGTSGNGGTVGLTAGNSDDAAGGEIAITAGTSTSGDGGGFTVTTGSGDSAGNILLQCGTPGFGTGGSFTVTATGGSNAAGGGITLNAGDSSTFAGGDVTITSGDSSSSTAGDINITSGSSGSGGGGDITISGGTGVGATGGAISISNGSCNPTADDADITVSTQTKTVTSAVTGGDAGDITIAGGDTACTDAGGTAGEGGGVVIRGGDSSAASGTIGGGGYVSISGGDGGGNPGLIGFGASGVGIFAGEQIGGDYDGPDIDIGTHNIDYTGTGTGGNAGDIDISGGTADVDNASGTGGNGGSLNLTAGPATSTNGTSGAGGSVNLTSGNSDDAFAGNINLTPGTSSATYVKGAAGSGIINCKGPLGSSEYMTITAAGTYEVDSPFIEIRATASNYNVTLDAANLDYPMVVHIWMIQNTGAYTVTIDGNMYNNLELSTVGTGATIVYSPGNNSWMVIGATCTVV